MKVKEIIKTKNESNAKEREYKSVEEALEIKYEKMKKFLEKVDLKQLSNLK